MMICKIPQHDVVLMLQTLNQLDIKPGVDNADMYVGLGMVMRNAIANAVEEPEEAKEGTDDG